MVVTAIFGLGGGSDFNSACLLASSIATDTGQANETIIILTAFAPIVIGDEIDLTQSIRKYTGLPYLIAPTVKKIANKDYEGCTAQFFDNGWPVITDKRRENAFGVFVPQKVVFPKEFKLCIDCLRKLISNLSSSDPPRIVAVDTGGDSLRGLVKGMGDRDISYLYGGVLDTRDDDSLILISEINLRLPFEIMIFGPGSDGETSALGLQQASEILVGDDHDGKEEIAGPFSVKLVEWGNMLSTYSPFFQKIAGWSKPVQGSTISNISRAIALCEENTISSQSVDIEIDRRGHIVCTVPAKFLASYWRVLVCLRQTYIRDETT